MVCNILPNAQTNESDHHISEIKSKIDENNSRLLGLQQCQAELKNDISELESRLDKLNQELEEAKANLSYNENKSVIYNGEDQEFEVAGNYEIRSTDSNFRRGNIILKPGASVHIKDKIADGIITVIGKLQDGIYDNRILEGAILPQIIHHNPVTDNLDITLIGDDSSHFE